MMLATCAPDTAARRESINATSPQPEIPSARDGNAPAAAKLWTELDISRPQYLPATLPSR